MKNSNNRTTKEERREPVVKTYQKTCTDMNEAFNTLCAVHPEIEEVLYPSFQDPDTRELKKVDLEGPILQCMLQNIISYVDYKRPDIEKMQNLSISLALKPNKVFLKTDRYVGFGWYLKYDKKSRYDSEITEADLTVTLYGQRSVDEYEKTLLDNGWEEFHYNK